MIVKKLITKLVNTNKMIKVNIIRAVIVYLILFTITVILNKLKRISEVGRSSHLLSFASNGKEELEFGW